MHWLLTDSSLTIQVQRVAAKLAHDRSYILPEIRKASDAHRIFRTCGVNPRSFLAIFDSDLDLALCFTASVYPQWVSRMPKQVLALRIEAFVEFLEIYKSCESPIQALCKRLEKLGHTEVTGNIDMLLLDLSYVASERLCDLPTVCADENGRKNGAAFYLGSCHRELLVKIHRNWSQYGSFLRYFKTFFRSPPSCLRNHQESKQKADKLHYDQTVEIEKKAFMAAASWPSGLTFSDSFQQVWEALWDKICSGFPYYAFHSTLGAWWYPMFKYYKFDRRTIYMGDEEKPILYDQERLDDHATYKHEFPIDELRVFREGYRLVRTTFVSNRPSETELKRKALDEMWQCHTEKKLLQSKKDKKDLREEELNKVVLERIKENQIEHYPTFTPGGLAKTYDDLRLRMWAYTIARFERLTNREIMNRQRPEKYRTDTYDPYPFQTNRKQEVKKGVYMIATLAKTMPRDFSLLGPFTAHVFLSSRVNSKYPRWDFKSYIKELWRWISDPAFKDSVESIECNVRYGATKGYRAEAAMLQALETDPIKSLVKDLDALEEEKTLEKYLSEQSLKDKERGAMDMLQGLIGNRGFHARSGLCKKCLGLQVDKKINERKEKVGMHWIVPVWYLTVVEQMTEPDIFNRLRVDAEEQSVVSSLIQAFKRKRCP